MQDFLLRVRNMARLVTVNEVTYCRSPEPISGASCPVQIEPGGEETTGERTTRANADANADVESLLKVQVVAEVYVQPAAGGDTTAAAGGATPAAGGGQPKDGGAANGGAKGGDKVGGTAK